MIVKALIGVSVLAAISTATAFAYRADAKLQRERAEILKESNDALRTDLAAYSAASEAYSLTLNNLSSAARASARALEAARKNDATLDACLSYDPGIDLTGGLLGPDPD